MPVLISRRAVEVVVVLRLAGGAVLGETVRRRFRMGVAAPLEPDMGESRSAKAEDQTGCNYNTH